MSRGLGRLQRTVLSILEENDMVFDTYQITARAYAIEHDANNQVLVTDAQLGAVRRALISLVNQHKKAVCFGRRFQKGRRLWASIRIDPETVKELLRFLGMLAP